MTSQVQGVTDTYGYTYDLAGWLTEVKLNGVTLTTYDYDSNGNRLTRTSLSGSTRNRGHSMVFQVVDGRFA
ncbi:MAG: RHS repeat protein [Deltaproteobacteria bacterium]|nr:RHS repeat protein [Deltaproteobacteria bacterium]